MTTIPHPRQTRQPDAYLTHATLDLALLDATQLAEHAEAAAAQLSRGSFTSAQVLFLKSMAQRAREDQAVLARWTARWAAILDAEAAAQRGAK